MALVIQSAVWEPSPAVYLFIFFSCFLSLFLYPHFLSRRGHAKSPSSSVFDPVDSFSSFRRFFLFFFSLASVLEGIWSVFGEFELTHYGASREDIVLYLCIGSGAALVVGSLLGMISDLRGQREMCVVFCVLHLLVGVWKRFSPTTGIWVASLCVSLATCIFSFSFETWAVVEHEKQAHRTDTLNEIFWQMTFLESSLLIGGQMVANWLVDLNLQKATAPLSTMTIFLAVVGIVCLSRGSKGTSRSLTFKDYKKSFVSIILGDKRIWLLAFTHSCLQFSIGVFWILWAPTLVADGREVHLGLIYPCLLGARMLGSTMFPWAICASVRIEDYLAYAFIASGLVLSIIAYDYQEIGVLVILCCLFHSIVGLIMPSLAKLRTVYVPNELRGGMIAFSLAPANAAILLLLIQRAYNQVVENSTMIALAAIGLFMAACCLYLLKRLGKQPYRTWHKL